MSGHQDWDSIVFKKRIPTNIRDAKKKGLVKTVKKQDNSNNLYKQDTNLKKLEDTDEAPKKIKFNLTKVIQTARFNSKISQNDLAKQLNLQSSVIKNYELGKVIPNKALLYKMGKILKVHLTGKNIGKPME